MINDTKPENFCWKKYLADLSISIIFLLGICGIFGYLAKLSTDQNDKTRIFTRELAKELVTEVVLELQQQGRLR